MHKYIKKTLIILFIVALITAAVLFFRYQVYYSRGGELSNTMFIINKGEGNATVAAQLEAEKVVAGRWYFYYYLRTHGLTNKIMPGDYILSGNMSIPEIAGVITNPEKSYVKVTFPEGLTSEEMADILGQNGYDKDGFLAIVADPTSVRDKFSFLTDKNITTLDGYLFPDTYFFAHGATAQGIVSKMLDNFGRKMNSRMLDDIKSQNKTLSQEIIMASIIQKEVKTDAEMKLASGVFWKRLSINMPLQSDTTMVTYSQKGLPLSPIANPGMDAITAAVYPQASDYLYFVSNTKTGETLFAKTLEEQDANIAKVGL